MLIVGFQSLEVFLQVLDITSAVTIFNTIISDKRIVTLRKVCGADNTGYFAFLLSVELPELFIVAFSLRSSKVTWEIT